MRYVGWNHLAEQRDKWWAFVYTVMNFWVPQNNGSFLSGLATVGLLRRIQMHGVSLLVGSLIR
jgi:hypothetical protein